ncbi:DUF2695 domain-containing protein [Allokutzneria sp. NRRL B-24872]|uniref:DUF2695 domain-containing protein n=1 Tax=Allokutzneria sp. NRRL B-24872 TaxID=1137961 RepID=UPI00143DA76B|nr:DUF2695 domain-containing protein [Allokutzneria sp. NRRL B-24872]
MDVRISLDLDEIRARAAREEDDDVEWDDWQEVEDRWADAVALPLDRPRLESLLGHVETAVDAEGCDHGLRATDAWAARNGVPLDDLHRGLRGYGGHCDCEVVLNVDLDAVFPRVRPSPN